MHQFAAVAAERRHPARARHVLAAAGDEGLLFELLTERGRVQLERLGEAVNL